MKIFQHGNYLAACVLNRLVKLVVSLVETRAALLASHGYETFALAYLVGYGPFARLIDLFGGLVSLLETWAALLASNGYVTFALAYLVVSGPFPGLI